MMTTMTTDEKSNWTNEEPESRNHYLRFECARVICSRQKIFHQKMCYECLLGSYHIHSRAHFMNIAQYLLTFLSHRMITGLMMQVLKRIFILIITTSSNVPMSIKYFISQIPLMMFAIENGRTEMLFLTQSIQSTALHPDFLCLCVYVCVCVCAVALHSNNNFRMWHFKFPIENMPNGNHTKSIFSSIHSFFDINIKHLPMHFEWKHRF